MKKKIANKIAEMRNSDKKGMEVLGWILTIVLTIAVVGIVWFFVQPAVQQSAGDSADGIVQDSNTVIDGASGLVDSATTGTKLDAARSW